MQLSKVKISNLFNFPYVSDIQSMEGIEFSNPQINNVNVFIGPNGAGKSTVLNIIKRIWKIGLVRDYGYNKDMIKDPKNIKNVVCFHDLYLDNVRKNYDFENKESRVFVEFKLNVHDYENIGFLCKHYEKLNTMLEKYSSIDFRFLKMNINDIQLRDHKIGFNFIFDIENKSITVDDKNLSSIDKYVLDYMKNIELVQLLIDIYNEFEKEEADKKWYPLKNSFAILNVNRSLKGITNEIDPNVWHSYIADKSSDKYESFVGGFLCIKKIWNILTNASEENFDSDGILKEFTKEEIDKKLNQSKFYTSLIFAVDKYLNKDLSVEYVSGKLVFWLLDKAGHRLNFDSLSDGEQSLLVIIFTIYGYDLKHGMLIIDEPELYFHPQMQKALVRMAEKISSNIGTQFIISTYSPLFVDDINIGNVYRFSKVDGQIIVKNPDLKLDPNEATLVHLLKFENMSKIFFVNKIIMVEGETDQYFFEFYIKHMHTYPEWKSRLKDYEIININGKGGYKMWSNFLSKFGIQSYFIGDWDNIMEFNILKQDQISYYYKQSKRYHEYAMKNKKNMSPYYSRLVAAIKDMHPDKYNYIIKRINELYKDNVFIMEKGDLETYLGMKHKGLQETVIFCHESFQSWLKNGAFHEHRKELEMMLEGIFGK